MSGNQKRLLIVERSVVDLKPTSDSKDRYVLEGTFTEFGIKNKNNRIYEASEFLPHLRELQEKIKNKKLVGELDHPKDFEISLARASHVIEDLSYNKDNNKVTGRIRLTSTSAGKDARALVDDGIPLHISSRAAGTVQENGRVKIQKLFTYDLVADPGFANAELNRVNEKYGFPLNENLSVFELDSEGHIVNQEKPSEEKYIETNKNSSMESRDFVTKEDFDKYSNYVKGEISQIKEMVAVETSKEGDTPESAAKLEKLINYTNHISESVNKLHNYVGYVAENVDKSIDHNDYLVENLNSLKDYANYLAENTENGVQFMNYLAENLDKNIQYGEYLAEKINESHTEMDGKVGKLLEYTEYVADKTDKNIQYSEYISEKAGQTIEYANYLKEGIAKLTSYNEYLAESLDKVVLNINESSVAPKAEAMNEVAQVEQVQESEKVAPKPKEAINENTSVPEEAVETAVDFRSRINDNLEKLVESATKQKADRENPDLHFLRFLNESKKAEFEALNESKQEAMVEAFKINRYFSNGDAERIWETVFTPIQEKLDFINSMPKEYTEAWTNMSESKQEAIKAQAKFHALNTQYQINNFWQTRDLRSSKVELEKIDESKKIETTEEDQSAVNENLDSLKNAIASRFNRV